MRSSFIHPTSSVPKEWVHPGQQSYCFSTLERDQDYGKDYCHYHIVPFGKFHRIGGATPETFPNVKYDAPQEVGGDSKCFYSPIRK